MALLNFRRPRLFKSLQTRLIIYFILIGLVPVFVVLLFLPAVYESVSIENDTRTLLSTAQFYTKEIIESGYAFGVEDEQLASRIKATADNYQGRFLITNDSLQVIRDTNGVDVGKIIIWENIVRSLKGETLSVYDKENDLLVATTPLINAEGNVVGVVMLSKSCIYLAANKAVISGYIAVLSIIFFVLTVFLAILISVRTTMPLKRTSKSLDEIKKGHYTTIPPRHSFKELEGIEDSTNDVIGQLRAMDESRQEFVSNVSHELKTPLTSMKVLADSLNSSDDFPVEMYREFMQDIGGEIDRETKIINDLLALVKLDKSGATLDVTALNMNELIESILKRLKPIADEAGVKVIFESFRPVNCEVDEVKITLAITNLVENAIKYNNPDGWVHVTLNSDHRYCFIKVKDNGLGIPKESIDFIFERFYRADKSHSREIGGTGLGLAITKSAIVMHKGDIKVASTLGEGTEFDVRIPLSYIMDEAENINAK